MANIARSINPNIGETPIISDALADSPGRWSDFE
jgi:hypothetical protein